MAECFRNFISLSPVEKARFGKNAKTFAENFYNVDNLVNDFEKMYECNFLKR